MTVDCNKDANEEMAMGKEVKCESYEFDDNTVDEGEEEDEFKEDIEEPKFDLDQVVDDNEKEKTNRDSFDNDDYDPPYDDSDSAESEADQSSERKLLKKSKKSLGRGRPPKRITDPKLWGRSRARKVKGLRVIFREHGCQMAIARF